MSDIFISHVKEDSALALAIAAGLEDAGYTTWYYERDILPGRSHLDQTSQAIEEARAVLLLVSPRSMKSNEVDSEVDWAHLSQKPFVPLLADLIWEDFEQHQRKWRRIIGSAVGITIPSEGAPAVIPRVVDGLRALGVAPKTPEEREAEARAKERQVRLAALRGAAINATKQQAWAEAASAWREYVALEPEDAEAAQAQLRRAEKQGQLARAYADAQAALGKRDYTRATALLKGIVVEDENYRDAARLLGQAIEGRRTGGRPAFAAWQIGAVIAGIVLIATLAVLAPKIVASLTAARPTASPTPPAAQTLTPKAGLSPTPGGTARGGALSPSPTPQPANKTPTLTRSPGAAATTSVATATRVPTATSPASSPAASTPPPTVAAAEAYTAPGNLVRQFFAPGPRPVALAVSDDALWVADENQKQIYKLDLTGAPQSKFAITATGTIEDLAWAGGELHLTLYPGDYKDPKVLVLRLDPSGKVLGQEAVRRPSLTQGLAYQVRDKASGATWGYRDEFVVRLDAAGDLVETWYAPTFGSVTAFAWAPDGLWLLNTFGEWRRMGFDGRSLASGNLSVGAFPYQPVLFAVEGGHLWISLGDRTIYQVALAQRQRPTPPPGPTATPAKSGKLALPRPQVKRGAVADKAVVQIVNELQGTMTVEFGNETALVAAGAAWQAELPGGVYSPVITANAPEPISFSGKELLFNGYEYGWVLSRPR